MILLTFRFSFREFVKFYMSASPHTHCPLSEAPRFELSSLEREIQAVDAENTNYSTDDVWRGVMLHKMTATRLMLETS